MKQKTVPVLTRNALKRLDRVAWLVFTVVSAVLVPVAGAAAASPPPNSPAYTVSGTATVGCNEANPDLQLSESFYFLGKDPPPGWANKLPPGPPPPGVKLLPQGPLQQDVRNVVGIAIENQCSIAILLSFTNVDGGTLYGVVAPGTDVFLTREDLSLAGLWQFEMTGFGVGGDPSAFPIKFIVTSAGVEPIGP